MGGYKKFILDFHEKESKSQCFIRLYGSFLILGYLTYLECGNNFADKI